jgi:hypothetical protein
MGVTGMSVGAVAFLMVSGLVSLIVFPELRETERARKVA